MKITEENESYFISFGMGFADGVQFKDSFNVFKIKMFDDDKTDAEKHSELYDCGYKTGKDMMNELIDEIKSLN